MSRHISQGLSPYSLAALVLLLSLLGSSAPVRAEQRELAIGVEPLYGLTYIDQRTPSGGGGDLHISYGITDALAVQVQGGATAHPLQAAMVNMQQLLPGTLVTWQASAGIVYALDVVRIVPFFEATLGILGTWTQTSAGVSNTFSVGASLGLGADYLITRRWAVGVVARYYASLTDLSQIPIYLTAGPRITVRFGL
jgi:hypothetical protein